MAAPKRQRQEISNKSALQFEQLDPEGQQAVKENWQEMGKAKSGHAAAVETATKARDNPKANPLYHKKQVTRLASLANVQEHLEDKPMTVEGATQARVTRMHEARSRAAEEGSPVPRGTAWYFGHHADIAAHAHKHGIDINRAITATTALSPENDPKTELKGGAALLDMIGNQKKHTIKITPELHAATKQRISDLGGPEIPANWVGKTKKLSQLHATHIAGISSLNASMREAKIPVQSTADFGALGATRKAAEVVKGIEHLRGQRSEEDTIDPHSSPKVWSYKEGVKNSVPGSKTHLEYLARGMNYQQGGAEGIAAGRAQPKGFRTEDLKSQVNRTQVQLGAIQTAGNDFGSARHAAAIHQASLANLGGGGRRSTLPDTRPERGSDEGVLSSEAHTAEDTWMHSISTGQTPKNVRAAGQGGSGTSVAKMAASDPSLASEKSMTKTSKTGSGAKVFISGDPEKGGKIANAALNHSINNYSTRLAARQEKTPAMMMQEVPWTEQRIQAEKDPDYAREMRAKSPPVAPKAGIPKQPVQLGRQFGGSKIDTVAAKAAYDKTTASMPTKRKRAG